MRRARYSVGAAVLVAGLLGGVTQAQSLDAWADRGEVYVRAESVRPLAELLGPVEEEARPDPASRPMPGLDQPEGGIDPDLWSEMGIAAPADAQALPPPSPAQAAADPFASVTAPDGWEARDIDGVRFAMPPGWMLVEDSREGQVFFGGDMDRMRGVILAVGFERDVADIRDEDALQIHAERDVTVDGQTLRMLEITADEGGVSMEGRILYSPHPLRGDESLMIGFMAANEPFEAHEALFVQIMGGVRLPPPPADNGPATEAPAASADASRDVEMLMRMVRLSMPGDWSRASTGEFAEVVSPGGGRVTFHLGREASALVAAIPAGTASSPVWMGNAPATEYALAEVALTVWDTCPFPGEPLVMQITGPEGFDRDPGVTRILTTLQVTFPGDAAHCGAAIIPGQGAASAEGPQPDVLPMETDAAEAASAGDAFIEDGSGYTIYRNARYGMTIAYPGTYFTPDDPPGNGDGRRFSSVDGQASFYVFAQYDALGEGLDAMRAADLAALQPVTEDSLAPGSYRIAGSRDGMAAMRRVIMDSDGMTRTFEIAYPPSRAAEFAAVVAYMADSFGPPALLEPLSVPVPQPTTAVPVPQPPSQPPAGTVAATAPPPEPETPATGSAEAVAGGWDLNANGHRGTLSIRQGAAGPEAVMNLGREEVLEDVRFDPASGRIEFYRPSGAQHYTGLLTGDGLAGRFNQGAGSDYVYAWQATRPAQAGTAPSPAAPVPGGFPATVGGLWAIDGNGHRGELRIAFGPDGLAGFVRFGQGRDEILANVSYDPETGQVEFVRPLGAQSTQHYVGLVDGAGIEGWYNEGAGSDYTYRWFATLLEADDFIPEDLAAAGSPVPAPDGPVSLGALRTPERGTAERSALTDTARVPIEREIGVPVIFIVTTLNTDGTWAYLQGRPVNPDGSPIDWSRTNFAREMAGDMMSDVAMVLMRNVGGSWGVVDHVFGPTDVHWIGWMEDIGLPEALFYP